MHVWRLAKILALLTTLSCCSCLGSAESPEPLTTAAAVATKIGQTAVVELTVVEVKHPRRRKAVFLTSSANFRSPQSLAVVIQDADLTHFGVKDDRELAERYKGRRIRARGQVARDEGQLIVRVSTGDQITIVDSTSDSVASGEIVVSREDKMPVRLSFDDLAKLSRQSVEIEHEGARHEHSGVHLQAVLQQAGVTLGEQARGNFLSRYVLVASSDGYQTLLSVGEVDPLLQARPILLANNCDGKALERTEGPWQLVVPGDLRQRRWVRSVTRIEVRYAEIEPTSAAQ